MRLSDVRTNKRIALIGDQDTGKTRLMGSFMGEYKGVILTADPEGLDTLRQLDYEEEPDVIVIEDWGNIWDYIKQVKASMDAGARILGIDDLTKIQSVAIAKVRATPRSKQEQNKTPRAFEEFVREMNVKGRRRMMQQHWGELSVMANSVLYELHRMAFPLTVLTLLHSPRDDPRTGEPRLFPNLLGGIREDILSHYSWVGNLFKSEDNGRVVWCCTTLPHPRIETKDRYRIERRTWIDPTGQQILGWIRGEGGTESDKEKRIGVGIPPAS